MQAMTADPAGRAPGGWAMVWLAGGTFHMGSDDHYPEEAPAHPMRVDGFWIDRTPVTNRDFAAFVAATGHVTLAERPPRPEDYPDAAPELMSAGSLVFVPPGIPGGRGHWSSWWRIVAGADWRHPQGPGSTLDGRMDHPVVHVCHGDALAYARWRGADLPSEAEWEFAARGGLDRAEFAWGDELVPGGVHRANLWQGDFPDGNLALDGYPGTSPVTAFPPNGFGLFDMIGNVWEWTDDWYRPHHQDRAAGSCCREPSTPSPAAPCKVLKGGSHLCAPSHCRRYRPAARQPQTLDTASVHIGFRCVRRVATS